MLIANPVFVEKTEYAYAVARVRALETKLVDQSGFASLLGASPDRLAGVLAETAGIKPLGDGEPGLLAGLEESFTRTFRTVKSLLLEEPLKRLVSLKYDYEMVKFIAKEERGSAGLEADGPVHAEISTRSNYPYARLKALLEGGKAMDTGETMMGAYLSLKKAKAVTGRVVDDACDRAFLAEAFSILNDYGNQFLAGYFQRQVDAANILTVLRLRARKEKRAAVSERYLPFGSVDVTHLEAGFESNLDGFAAKLAYTPYSGIMKGALRGADETEQAIQLERALDEERLKYLKEAMFVTFGVEPVLAYLWVRENEVRNLRTILLSKASGLPPDEIRRHLRGFHG